MPQPPGIRAATPDERWLDYMRGAIDSPTESPSGVPGMRAASTSERLGDMGRNLWETVRSQPLVRMGLEAVGSSQQEQDKRWTEPPPVMSSAVALTKKASPTELISRLALKTPQWWEYDATPQMKASAEQLQNVIYELANKYPRLTSHLNRVELGHMTGARNPSSTLADFSDSHLGSMARSRGIEAVKERGQPFGDLRFNVNKVANLNPEEMRAAARHELGHLAQALGDPTRADLAYQLGSTAVGYGKNPAEQLSRMLEQPVRNESLLDRTLQKIGLLDSTKTRAAKNAAANEQWRIAREAFTRHPNTPQAQPPTLTENEAVRKLRDLIGF